ncbi:Regulator of chromosome condensation (RCC1) family protein [Abeliophyllum distichum]|uniref:Regulator of chromosome condensation (RCC1) family protein n=1 Tax=Abeliophyllum distichum TaxID=126358 RepID=A0ABD1P9J3_9LAMI
MLIFKAAVVAVLELSKTNKDRINTSSAFELFKNNYLLVYSLMMAESKEGIMQRIPNLEENEVLHIVAGAEHSALVTGNGSVMTWGWGEHGQLGLGDTVDQTNLQVVSLGHNLTEERAISRVYCGSGFSFVLRTYDGHSQIR